jgi:hypothetical protein
MGLRLLEPPTPLSNDADNVAITGLRDVVPSGTPHPSNAPPAAVWETDDGLETDAPVLAGELLAGRYIVEGTLAEGGMGIVCLGRHAQLEQPVAIKFLKRALSGRQSVVQRFLNEGRALAALRSEHVVRVMDVGQLESGRPYLVMEHLEGTDLDKLIERNGALDVDTAVKYTLQVCEALGEAHALGIVHRDIKPENLFLWSGGPGKDIVKVLDFGLAKRLDAAHALGATGPQDSLGSPCYMSPEQIMTPSDVDERTDVWSLGVVLYRLLTDSLPFDGTDVMAVFSHVIHAAPMSLRDTLPGVDPELDAIVLRCLQKAPQDRFASVHELSRALESYMARRREGASLPPPPPVPHFADDDAKIRIPGVHARWPYAVVVLLGLLAAGAYDANRTGRLEHVRLRAAALQKSMEGKYIPAPLRATEEVPFAARIYEPRAEVAFGVVAKDPVVTADGSLTVRAVPERGLEPSSDEDTTGMTDDDRAQQQAAYREYFAKQKSASVDSALSPP